MDDECRVHMIDKSPTIEERAAQTEVRLGVTGMGCPTCVNRVRNSLLLVYGVLSVDISLDQARARVLYNPGLVQVPALLQAVAAAGGDGRHEYRARVIA